MSKLFQKIIFTVCLGALVSVLAACGESTATNTAPSSTPGATATPVVTPQPATATPLPVPTATPGVTTPPTSPTPKATAGVTTPPAPSPVPTLNAADLQKAVPVVGELPAPPEARKLNFTLDMIKSLQKRLGGKPGALDLSGLVIGAYAVTGQPVDTLDYYRAVMRAKGWTESRAYNNLYGIYFEKGDQVAIVTAVGVPDETTVTFLAGLVRDVRGQIQGGEVRVLLGQGPPAVFESLTK